MFLSVARDRGYTMAGPLPISNRNLLDYFEIHAVPRDEWTSIEDFVSRIDGVWLSEQEEAAKAAKPPAETGSKPAIKRP